MNAIEVESLVKKYGEITAVNGVSFKVPEGTLFGFLGPNGAGKTTLISILCTLLRLTSGRAVVNGYDVAKEPNKVRSSIGIIFQEASLDERLTAMENLRFHAKLYGVPGAEGQLRIGRLLDSLELTSWKDKLVRTFSGGMKRRLEIARGLLHNPKVLFLDEPTLGLDPQARNYLWEHILSLRQEENITVFLTTHYMEEAEVCDEVAIIDKGRLIAHDSPEHLKKEVGGELVRIETEDDPEKWRELLSREYGLPTDIINGTVQLEVSNGESFLPQLLRRFNQGITSVSLKKPSLEDVFLRLTGKTLRDEQLDDSGRMKERHRLKRRK